MYEALGGGQIHTENGWWALGPGEGWGSVTSGDREWTVDTGESGRGHCFMGTESPLGKMQSSEDGWWGWLHNGGNVLRAPELWACSRLIR